MFLCYRDGEMQPIHPKKMYNMFDKAYQGDVFELHDKAHKGNQSNEIKMNMVMMRPNHSSGIHRH